MFNVDLEAYNSWLEIITGLLFLFAIIIVSLFLFIISFPFLSITSIQRMLSTCVEYIGDTTTKFLYEEE